MTINTQNDSTADIIEYALRLGDDSLILGHRLSEWASNGPFLEEDIALGNVALDYLGRARMYYTYAAELSGEGKTEDDYAYLRDERDFSNHLLNELPKGDFAYTIVRQLFIDVFNALYLPLLQQSADENLAAIASKSIKETRYHLRRSQDWCIRLGDGTEESHQRMQKSLGELWGYVHELFEQDALEDRLIEQDIAVDSSGLKDKWLAQITETLNKATLAVPDAEWAVRGGRKGYHTEHLGHLLSVMQSVHRRYPGAKW
ncbi:1,2-phenylacetyl-CoA epoxidase subunit PaaC [Paraglaciecola chathamensis]|uniref:Phenylacetic acid degradation protein n=1 Tax=Paraglaciecola agarilytica NO2 TaxID=1125747 RepID=A0ABQ0I9Y8_9ALTE|nr:1,2-phenylacetyl-CoA epoxidase subunit PaaC [Paraglaciecola agarilytica]GAC06187.1 phenylacetic acid degradation protein [Paraglaciecola agarilytica NO2]